MAEAVRVRSNREFRDRLMEKALTNVTETGKLAQQLTKSSRSREVRTKTSAILNGNVYKNNVQADGCFLKLLKLVLG